ncbi:MAG: hypothetical protein FD123_2700 [Bacteroidetes bacterium]|nr:MAG: hypothetical protein FD123_2700 [Bacteroidota bacterium]
MGELYPDRNPYHLQNLAKMHKRCSCCRQTYEPETGFYYGAMYASYALSVAIVMPLMAVLHFVFHLEVIIMFSIIGGLVLVMYPLIFRWSRNLWLNIFVPYDPEKRRAVLSGEMK